MSNVAGGIKKIRGGLLVGVLALLASGCATMLPSPGASLGGEGNLKNICQREGVSWQLDNASKIVTLRYKGIKAEVLVGSNLVLIGGKRVTLDSSVYMAKKEIIVPRDFQGKVIGLLHRQAGGGWDGKAVRVREIIIDAGHGGKDPGALGRANMQEKKIVLDIAQRLKKILRGRGVKVKMTRDRDEFISLQERTEITSRSKADLFVSIHANASKTRSVHGLEVFQAKYLNAKERKEAQRKTNRRLMYGNLLMKKEDANVGNIVSDMLYTHKQVESEALAKQLAEKTSRLIKTKNRGDKTSRFYVLRNTLIPAVLVEVGFVTNPKEAKLLRAGSYRQRIARGLAESILDYIKMR